MRRQEAGFHYNQHAVKDSKGKMTGNNSPVIFSTRNPNDSIDKFEYDKVYPFDLTDQVLFGPLSTEILYKVCKDGRVASKFLEHSMTRWFPELNFVDKSGYDYEDNNGRRYDLKSFTRRGCNYSPSHMIGAGRKLDMDQFREHASHIDYIISDITCFPEVFIVFKRGTDLLEQYPSGKISVGFRKVLFEQPEKVEFQCSDFGPVLY
jgi:hypothetical protein